MKEDLNKTRNTIQEAMDEFLNKWFPEYQTEYKPVKVNIKVYHDYQRLTYKIGEEYPEEPLSLVQNTVEVSLTLKS